MKNRVMVVILTVILVFCANIVVAASTFTQADYPTNWTFVNGRTVQVEFHEDGSFGFWSGNRVWNQLVAANMIHLPNAFNGGIATKAAILNGRIPAPNVIVSDNKGTTTEQISKIIEQIIKPVNPALEQSIRVHRTPNHWTNEK